MPKGTAYQAYLEVGDKRVFAGALDWPGWCRSGRDPAAALQALLDYGRRYKAALGRVAQGFKPPTARSGLEVVQRLKGDATTDFGAPGKAPTADDRPLQPGELKRLQTLLRASWRKFDRAAEAAAGSPLRKGPRGGGREVDAIVRHVLDADQAYLTSTGGRTQRPDAEDVAGEIRRVRREILQVLSSRARGEPPPRTPRSGKLWAPRYAIRRSAWHALDHAWEIEDRAAPA